MNWFKEIGKHSQGKRLSWIAGAAMQALGEVLFLAQLHQLIQKLVDGQGQSGLWLGWGMWLLTASMAVALRSAGFNLHQGAHYKLRTDYRTFLNLRALKQGFLLDRELALGKSAEEVRQKNQVYIESLEKGLEILPASAQSIFLLVGILPFLLYLAPYLTLILLGAYLPLMILMGRLMRGLKKGVLSPMKSQQKAQVRDGIFYAFRQSVISTQLKKWSEAEAQKEHLNRAQKEMTYLNEEVKVASVSEAVTSLWIVFSLGLAGWQIEADPSLAGQLLTFCSALVFLYKPLKETSKKVPLLQKALVAHDEYLEWIKSFENQKSYLQFELTDDRPQVKLENLSGGYDQKAVHQNLTQLLYVDEPLWVSGANGVGKSTLFKLICGRATLQAGDVRWPKEWSANDLFYLSQNPQIPLLQIDEENLSSLLASQASLELRQKLKVDKIWDRYQAWVRGSTEQGEELFSGGEQQRLSVYFALICQPKLLLLDEPFSGVPQGERLELIDWIKDYCQEKGMGLWVISHDVLKGFKNWEIKG